MTHSFKSAATVFLAMAVFFMGCQGNTSETPITDPLQTLELSGVKIGNNALPQGTEGFLSEGGAHLEYIYPQGVVFLPGIKNDIATQPLIGGCYDCKSTCSGGCDVVNLAGNIGCSSCPEGSTAACTGKHCSAFSEFEDGGFLDLEAGIDFVGTGDFQSRILGTTSPTWEVMMSYEAVREAFDSFYSEVWEGETLKEETLAKALFARVQVFGVEVALRVPSSVVAKNAQLKIEEVACSCTTGTSGCEHEEIKKGFMIIGDKCVAGACENCRMTF